MVLSKAQKNEDTLVKTYEQGMKNLITTETKLNGSMMKGIASYTKWVSQLSASNKISTDKLKIARIDEKKSKEQLVVKEKLKKADEHLIKLRHRLNIDQEREHGEQVRRNINLRHNMDSFNDKFEMLKKSLTGGFGFQAAIGTTIKKMGSLTRSYQEYEIAQNNLKDATKKLDGAMAHLDYINSQENPDASAKKALEDEIQALNMEIVRLKQSEKSAEDSATGTQGKAKPIFEKLSKLGEFLGKKAVPIGLGVGAAGVLISVITKSFSASPLFAQMMKLLKFSVQLILMPIGTFFGALLRPILITLLRKFIIPFYSTWMPKLMSLGTQLGDWMVTLTPEGIAAALKELISPTNPATLDEIEKNKEIRETNNQAVLDEFTSDPAGFIWRLFNLPTVDNVLPPSDATEQIGAPTLEEYDPNAGDADGKFQPKDGGTYDPYAGRPIPEYAGSLEHIFGSKAGGGSSVTGATGEFLTKDDYNNPIIEASNKMVEQNKEEIRIEKRDRAMNQMNALMDKYRETGGIIEDTMPKFGQREQLWNEVYNKGGDIKNAGANIAAANARNASAGYTMGGSAKSQSILEAYNAFKNGVSAANGFDGMVNSPTMFLAGEAGAEHVTVTPNGQGGGSNITINIQNMNGSDNDLRRLKKTILEVIQESSANRGRL